MDTGVGTSRQQEVFVLVVQQTAPACRIASDTHKLAPPHIFFYALSVMHQVPRCYVFCHMVDSMGFGIFKVR